MREGFAPPTGLALEEAISPIREDVFSKVFRSRSRPRPRIAMLSVLGATVAVVLVAGSVTGFGLGGASESAAASTLNAAADAALRTTDPVLTTGQYLKVTTHKIASYDGDAGSRQSGVFLYAETSHLFIPADRSDDWVRVDGPLSVVQTFGDLSERAAVIAAENTGTTTLRAPGGRFYGTAPDVTPATLQSLPRDSVRLLAVIHTATGSTGNSRDGEAFVFIADTLRSGIVPADLRAALYRAAALIPGVTITDDEATVDRRTGVAFGRSENNGTRQEIIIDPATGLLIGERTVQTSPDATVLPIGTVLDSTAVATTTVNTAPNGGSVCGDPLPKRPNCP